MANRLEKHISVRFGNCSDRILCLYPLEISCQSLEPIPPIHIQAPQPTLVLQTDYARLRAELNSQVRPPGELSLWSFKLKERFYSLIFSLF